MKSLPAAALLLAAAITPGLATEVWQGDLFITTASAGCANDGIAVGDYFTAIYRPRNLVDNGPDTRLALVASRSAQRYEVTNAPLSGSGPYKGVFITSRANVQTWTGTFSAASVSPATPTATTQTVVIKATFTNFADVVGCTATLKGSLGNRP